MAEIRPATESDLEGLNDLYNYYVRETHITFDIEPMTMVERREWFRHYGETGRHRLWVAVNGDVIGYASTSPYRPKQAYETSVETSIYLVSSAVGKGLGRRLYAELFKSIEAEDVHRAYAGIALPNAASIALHERFGFRRAGVYSEQGRKFGRFWDVGWYEKALSGRNVGGGTGQREGPV